MVTVAAIIVTFNTGKKYIENFLTILNQVDKIIIVDNGSDIETIDTLKLIENTYNKAEIIYNNENLGLAKAQNIGIKKALEASPKWILLLDDDSQAEQDMISTMLDFYNNYNSADKLAIIAPHIKETMVEDEAFYYVRNSNLFNIRQKFSNQSYLDVFFTIASGSLIKAKIFTELGMFREDFFIDYIDIEYGLRVCMANYKIIVLKNAVLKHRLGNKKIHKFLNFSTISFNHNSTRKYYIYRNRIKVWRLYFKKFPVFILYDIMSSIYHIFKIIFFEQDKINKISAMIKGIKKGFTEDL